MIMNWIKVENQKPPLDEMVEVKWQNGETGSGYRYNNGFRSGWKSKRTGDHSYYNLAWSGLHVTEWRYFENH